MYTSVRVEQRPACYNVKWANKHSQPMKYTLSNPFRYTKVCSKWKTDFNILGKTTVPLEK